MQSIMTGTAQQVQQEAQALVFIVTTQNYSDIFAHALSSERTPDAALFAAAQEFNGKAGQVLVVPAAAEGTVRYTIFSGMDSAADSDAWPSSQERYRRALGKAVRAAQSRKCASLAVIAHEGGDYFDSTSQWGQEVAIALGMSYYAFNDYRTKKKDDDSCTTCWVVPPAQQTEEFKKGLVHGQYIATSVNKARHWIDLPPCALTPIELASKAQAIADKHGLHITTFDEQQIIEMGMGGLRAVSAGSEHDCRFVILEYRCSKDGAPTLGFVGKGVTFDSGGLSIKPAQYMETMKEDMSGAAAVIASMEAIAQLKPEVNVIAITPLTENLPSGKATKPGDIIRFYNGVTAEVKNTDAEGRLILADALAYMEKQYAPDMMIDLATLTGACAYALGPFFSGMMTTDDELAQRIDGVGKRSGDVVWRLPLTTDYKKAIASEVADIQNIGSRRYMAGATTAGLFLQAFVDKTPWVHLDIAGTAFNVPDIPYYRADGATGSGVRLLIELARSFKG